MIDLSGAGEGRVEALPVQLADQLEADPAGTLRRSAKVARSRSPTLDRARADEVIE